MSDARKPARGGHELLTELMLAVFRVNGRLLAKGDELVLPLGLTSARWQMLGAIALAGEPQTAPQAAEAMGVTRQAAQKQLNLLLEEGLVELQPNPRHQRLALYALTTAGASLYATAAGLNQLWTRRLASGMDKADIANALDVLAELYEGLEGPLPTPEALK
ncbi:MAG TPA: MarR family winged helix-turn-helix transcriptional regulator [Ramlibacter sp.]|nr:MarR family winged helix-turn-helix transcriptional regulator [Ramlibacter sp.]